jgi:hypothetical protein
MSVNIDQVLEAKSSQHNPTVLNAAVMSNEIVLRFAKLIPRIRGEFACKFSLWDMTCTLAFALMPVG